jgi:hypothetical protein
MFFEITTGLRSRYLTPAQRTSPLFREGVTVFGKTIRRNAPPIRVTYEQFMGSRDLLMRMLGAGAIHVEIVDPDMSPSRIDFMAARRSILPPQAVTQAPQTATLPKPSAPVVSPPGDPEDESELN